jgi:hypothetical protein
MGDRGANSYITGHLSGFAATRHKPEIWLVYGFAISDPAKGEDHDLLATPVAPFDGR